MFANSRQITSSQAQPHPQLATIVQRHLCSTFRKPPSLVARQQFEQLQQVVATVNRPLVLDSGCGTGASSARLSQRHPDALIIGVDKSAQRLAVGARVQAGPSHSERVMLLRCDLVDFWLLAQAAGWRFQHQYLLYPNPWPKAAQVQRRWHAHPILPALLACGGTLHLRTNWPIYAQEWAAALALAGWHAQLAEFTPAASETPLSPFERKYLASGHTLWQVLAQAVDDA